MRAYVHTLGWSSCITRPLAWAPLPPSRSQVISQAYEVLSSPERRKLYDAHGLRSLHARTYEALHQYFGAGGVGGMRG